MAVNMTELIILQPNMDLLRLYMYLDSGDGTAIQA